MIIRLKEEEGIDKCVLVELQGELEVPEDVSQQGIIGTIEQIEKGDYQLEISNRIRLLGKRIKLPKPFLLIQEDPSGLSLLSEPASKKLVLITEKILFNSRPMTILE